MKVVKVNAESIQFEDGSILSSYHQQDCCEHHYLSFGDVAIEDYGIELVPVHGHSVKVPGYGYNNGYYSANLDLVLTSPISAERVFHISECQVIND